MCIALGWAFGSVLRTGRCSEFAVIVSMEFCTEVTCVDLQDILQA